MEKTEQERIEEIEKIHHEYEEKLEALRREQGDVLSEYLAELEKAKMEELRNKLQS